MGVTDAEHQETSRGESLTVAAGPFIHIQEATMLLIRELMYCKPGKVKPMVEKFLAMSKLNEQAGMGKMRIMTDFCAERYWTIVAEFEVASLKDFEDMMSGKGPQLSAAAMKEMEQLMTGYHDFVVKGRREIYKIEG
jgi:hypothetical protein